MLNSENRPGSRCSTPQFPFIPYSIPPSFAVGRELGDTGCRGQDRSALILDLVTEPTDANGSDRSFRC
jgi:hypothetical protein